MLIFGWSSMVDSGRSFSTSLKTNHFSVTQVTVLAPWTKVSERDCWLRLSWVGVGWVDSIDIRFYFFLENWAVANNISPWCKWKVKFLIKNSQKSMNLWSSVAIASWLVIIYHTGPTTTPNHIFWTMGCLLFISLSTLSALPRVFCGGIPDMFIR